MPPSLVESAFNDVIGHELDPVVDQCKAPQGRCELESGHEVTFVSLVADYLLRGIKRRIEEQVDYNQWVYMPSRKAEKLVGYDLSVGRYDQHGRMRSMHKLLLSWCDKRRQWTMSPRTTDHSHLKALFRDWSSAQEFILPFLILHVCYCIHEYRRMDTAVDEMGFKIPGVESLLRTVVIPLGGLFEKVIHINIDLAHTTLKYYRDTNRRQPNESPQVYLDRIGHVDNHHVAVEVGGENIDTLPVLTLHQWKEEVSDFLSIRRLN